MVPKYPEEVGLLSFKSKKIVFFIKFKISVGLNIFLALTFHCFQHFYVFEQTNIQALNIVYQLKNFFSGRLINRLLCNFFGTCTFSYLRTCVTVIAYTNQKIFTFFNQFQALFDFSLFSKTLISLSFCHF